MGCHGGEIEAPAASSIRGDSSRRITGLFLPLSLTLLVRGGAVGVRGSKRWEHGQEHLVFLSHGPCSMLHKRHCCRFSWGSKNECWKGGRAGNKNYTEGKKKVTAIRNHRSVPQEYSSKIQRCEDCKPVCRRCQDLDWLYDLRVVTCVI